MGADLIFRTPLVLFSASHVFQKGWEINDFPFLKNRSNYQEHKMVEAKTRMFILKPFVLHGTLK